LEMRVRFEERRGIPFSSHSAASKVTFSVR
jgi:hypothetical protein